MVNIRVLFKVLSNCYLLFRDNRALTTLFRVPSLDFIVGHFLNLISKT
jgi:hypothetical protein